MGQQRHDGVETQQTGHRALDGTIRPLPLGFEAQMGAAFREGRFTAPALDELLHNRAWPIMGTGRDLSAWRQAACGIAHEHPADGQHRLATLCRWSLPAPGGGCCTSACVCAAMGCGPP